ncbi:M15 family metallopeptidase [Flavihumibacter profundi]|nr:hypothetical protein [Flavihumibacter profundi]
MGTSFDNFSDSAHNNSRQLPEYIFSNRKKLKTVMGTHGSKAMKTEWWH